MCMRNVSRVCKLHQNTALDEEDDLEMDMNFPLSKPEWHRPSSGLYCIEDYHCFVGFAYLAENSIYFFRLIFRFIQERDLGFVQITVVY